MKKIPDTIGDNVQSSFRQAGPYLGLGVQFAATTLIMVFAGSWVDGKLNSSPWFVLIGGIFGGFAATYNLIKTVTQLGKQQHVEKK